MTDNEFRTIKKHEIPELFDMILKRIKWMDDNGIIQWNAAGYDRLFPLSYFEKQYKKDRIYVLSNIPSGRLTCGAVMLDRDPRWDHMDLTNDGSAVYVHNFVSRIGCPGAGAEFLAHVERLASEKGCSYIRLDSASNNPRLTKYYRDLGFVDVGTYEAGTYKDIYHGILRQKKLSSALSREAGTY